MKQQILKKKSSDFILKDAQNMKTSRINDQEQNTEFRTARFDWRYLNRVNPLPLAMER